MSRSKIFILAFLFGVMFSVKTQVLLSTDFNLGLPVGWGMAPSGSWSVHPFFGTSMSKCLYTEEMNTASATVSFFSSPLNLLGLSTLTITFKAACTKNNFLVPNVAVFYDAGAGKQLVARWGSGFTAPTTYTINDVADYVPPLDSANIEWISCTHTLSAPVGTQVSFYFDAEMINAGYVLLEDIVIAGKSITVTSALPENAIETTSIIFPNPVKNGQLIILGENISGVSIVNVSGQNFPLKYRSDSNETILDLHAFTPGIYFLRYTESRKTFVKRIVVE